MTSIYVITCNIQNKAWTLANYRQLKHQVIRGIELQAHRKLILKSKDCSTNIDKQFMTACFIFRRHYFNNIVFVFFFPIIYCSTYSNTLFIFFHSMEYLYIQARSVAHSFEQTLGKPKKKSLLYAKKAIKMWM